MAGNFRQACCLQTQPLVDVRGLLDIRTVLTDNPVPL